MSHKRIIYYLSTEETVTGLNSHTQHLKTVQISMMIDLITKAVIKINCMKMNFKTPTGPMNTKVSPPQ